MGKSSISPSQLFALILLFLLGTALVVPIGLEAQQSIWVSILLAMIGGILLFLVFNCLYREYQLRLNTLVLVSRGTDAASVLKVLTPLEKTPARAIAGRIEYASKIWAENLEINVDDIIKALISQGEPVIKRRKL